MLRFCPYIPVFRDLLARDKRQEPNPQELEHLHNLLSYRKHSYIPPQFQSASQLNLIMPSIKREVLPPDHCKRTQAPFQSKSDSADMDCSLSIMQFLCHIPQAQNGFQPFPCEQKHHLSPDLCFVRSVYMHVHKGKAPSLNKQHSFASVLLNGRFWHCNKQHQNNSDNTVMPFQHQKKHPQYLCRENTASTLQLQFLCYCF